jgi:hypothetical protein
VKTSAGSSLGLRGEGGLLHSFIISIMAAVKTGLYAIEVSSQQQKMHLDKHLTEQQQIIGAPASVGVRHEDTCTRGRSADPQCLRILEAGHIKRPIAAGKENRRKLGSPTAPWIHQGRKADGWASACSSTSSATPQIVQRTEWRADRGAR